MLNKYYLLISSVLIIILAGSVVYLLFFHGPRLVYVDNVSLFQNFDMSKELTAQLEKTTKAKQDQLDSLKFKLETMQMKIQSADSKELLLPEYRVSEMELKRLSERFENEYNRSEDQYNSQIWTHLNQYIGDYAEAHGIDIVMGANGDGTIMHGSAKFDITDELINYVNQRYAGNN